MFTEQQDNIITGLLLGDGHLSLKGRAKNASLVVRRAQHDLGYLEYHAGLFSKHLTPRGVKKFSRFDKRTNKYYHACEFTLGANPDLTNIYGDWYINKKKIVPKYLKLNPEIIATWFCDDGWIHKSKNDYFDIGFATDSFLEEDIFFLQNLLSERYSERINLSKRKNGAYQIHLSDYAASKLIIDIDSAFPRGMERKRIWDLAKLKDPNREKSFSIKESSDLRKYQVEEFIKNNNSFYLIDLTRYMNWYFTRRDGSTELDTKNAKRYLKKYLDECSLIEIPRSKENYSKGISFKKNEDKT